VPKAVKPVRCAIYTRKSTEEARDQEFSSLDAQREAALAYIKSQASQGWTGLKTPYNDGGFSGGTMERPALKRCLLDARTDTSARTHRGKCSICKLIQRASESLVGVASSLACLGFTRRALSRRFGEALGRQRR
jgi:DNA invertase Pin-like site-specific DNA recombinase